MKIIFDTLFQFLVLVLLPTLALAQTGSINVDENHNGHKIINVSHPPVNDHDAATKKYVDDHSGGGGGGTPGGANTQIQYNNSGAFGGISTFTTDGTNLSLSSSGTAHFAGTGLQSLRIGTGSTAAGDAGVAIGYNAQGSDSSVTVGWGAGTGGQFNVAVGREAFAGTGAAIGAIAIGDVVTANNNGSIVIGATVADTAAQQLIIGGWGKTYPIRDVYIGGGVTDSSANLQQSTTYHATGGTGLNQKAENLIFAGGIGTGTGIGGSISFKTAAAGTTGSSANPLTTRLTIDSTGSVALDSSATITGKGTVPTGGTTNQVLQKNSNTNYDVGWATAAGGGGNVSNTGTPLDNQVAVFTDATHIEGNSNLSFDATTNILSSVIMSPTTGFRINGAAANRRILVGNATNFVQSTETYAVPGTSGNVMLSDGTNWTSAQLGFSSLSGNWTLAQGPSITAAKLLGRTDASAGIPQEITLGTNLAMSGTTLNATGGGGGTPGGSNTQVQYNNSSAFGGISGATTNGTTLSLKNLTMVPTSGTINSTIDFGANLTAAALWLYNNGASSRIGWGVQSGEFQTFASSAAHFSWNGGGDLQTSGSSEVMRLDITSGNLTINKGGLGMLLFSNSADTGIKRNLANVIEINNGTAGQWGALKAGWRDSATNSVTNGVQIGHQSSGVPAAGFGSGVLFNADDSTTADVNAGDMQAKWTTATHNSNVSDFVFRLTNGTASLTPAASIHGAGYVDAVNGFQIGAAAASGKILIGDGTKYAASTPTWPAAAGAAGYTIRSNATNFTSYPAQLVNSSVTSQSPSTSDVYLAGSNIVVTAGDFQAKGQYKCVFDMTKSAGTGAIVITLRAGVNGSTADAAIQTYTFGAGTSVADTGIFEVIATWRTVGSGTSAVIQGICRGTHQLATTGLFNNAGGWVLIGSPSPSAGFASNTFTNIGLSFNGSTAFAGTTQVVQAQLQQ